MKTSSFSRCHLPKKYQSFFNYFIYILVILRDMTFSVYRIKLVMFTWVSSSQFRVIFLLTSEKIVIFKLRLFENFEGCLQFPHSGKIVIWSTKQNKNRWFKTLMKLLKGLVCLILKQVVCLILKHRVLIVLFSL